MRTLRLHTELYSDAAIESAVTAFSEYATITTERTEAYVVLSIAAKEVDAEAELAASLANFALAATVEGRGNSLPGSAAE